MFQSPTLMGSGEYKGKLIVFEGADGSGKSTMLRMLAENLRGEGKKVLVTMQPTPEMRELHIFKRAKTEIKWPQKLNPGHEKINRGNRKVKG